MREVAAILLAGAWRRHFAFGVIFESLCLPFAFVLKRLKREIPPFAEWMRFVLCCIQLCTVSFVNTTCSWLNKRYDLFNRLFFYALFRSE